MLGLCRGAVHEFRRRGTYVSQLTPDLARAVAALDGDPDHIAFQALQRGDREGQLDALQLWTSWPRREVAALLHTRGPRLSVVDEALIVGLQSRAGRRLGHGERGSYDLLVQLYGQAGGRLPVENADESGLLRVCERCDLVSRGPRNAARCPNCGHRHSTRIDHEPPQFTPCPVCATRPVTDAQARCHACRAERTKTKKAVQARARRARRRDAPPPP
jgi:hypothetical protein